MASDIIKLKEMTGAGVLDCKKALDEANGDFDKAVASLREKGQAKALKKSASDRIAAEGVVGSYIHLGGKIGVLVEVNCETDFAQKSERFQALVKDIAMHIAASNPIYVHSAEVPADILDKEREIFKNKIINEKGESILTKTRKDKTGVEIKIIDDMLDGMVKKYYQDYCLLDQSFIKEPSKTVRDIVNEAIAFVGEKITIRRFTRYEMGEGIEKQTTDFAEEVSKQMATK
ncbi:MAG: translation elongation factor Ts [Christensenellaceae bacterium]|jgi:elongation factor Ts|nr:translation elongation factor Ts [Christensenellaceae bacterium]